MNNCGECTACCLVFDIPEIQKQKHTLCVNCEEGCTIYHKRPKTCKEYECAWLKGNWNEKLRPDNCGVIIDLNINGYQALRFKDEVDPIIMKQIEFIKKTYNIDIQGVDARGK